MRRRERTPLAWIATCGFALLVLIMGSALAALADGSPKTESPAEATEGGERLARGSELPPDTGGTVAEGSMSRRPTHGREDEGGGLGELLNGPSGVRVATMCTNCNVANVTMCGQTGDHVQVIADGVPVAGGLGGIYLFSVAPSDLIARTEIVRGAGTVLSGAEAAVGAVLFDTRIPGREPRASASIDVGNYGWNGAKAMYMTREGRVSGGVVATVSRSDGIDANGDGNFNLGKSERETVAVELDFEISPQTFLRVGGNSYQEEQEGSKGAYAGGQVIELGNFYAEDIDIDRVEGFTRLKHDFDDGGSFSVATRYTERDQNTSDNSAVLYQRQPYMTIAEEFLMAAATYQRPIWNKHVLLVGLEYKDMVTEGTIWDFPEQIIRDVVEQESAFAQVELSLPKSVNVTLGARYDSFSHPGSVRVVGPDRVDNEGDFGSRVSPRARIGWKPVDDLSLSLSAGAGFAAPRPILERICCGAKVQSNASVKPERSTNLLLDADWLPWSWLHVKAGLFRNEYREFIEKRAVFTYSSFHPAFQQVNIPEATIEKAPSAELRPGQLAIEARVERWTIAIEGTRLSAKADSTFEIFPFQGATPSDPFYPFRDISYEVEAGPLIHTPRDTGSMSVGFEDKRWGFSITGEAQYTGSQRIQQQPESGIGLVVEDAQRLR